MKNEISEKQIDCCVTIIRKMNEETRKESERINNYIKVHCKDLNVIGQMSEAYEQFNKRYYVVNEMVKLLRECGFDVKMNMQNYEMTYCGLIK